MKLTFDEIETAITSIVGGNYIPDSLNVEDRKVTFAYNTRNGVKDRFVILYPYGCKAPGHPKQSELVELSKQIW